MEKICLTCWSRKEVSEFYSNTSHCKECRKKKYPQNTPAQLEYKRNKSREWRRDNPEAAKQINARALAKRQGTTTYKHARSMSMVKFKYGLTEEQLQDILMAQQGLCAICQTDLGLADTARKRAYAVDHDHKTGKVRGLLCTHCNTVLGHLEKLNLNPIVYAEYLQKHG